MDFKGKNVFAKNRDERRVSIENHVFSESVHGKNGCFRFRRSNRRLTENALVNSTIVIGEMFSTSTRYQNVITN